jgi:hypothetical protein
MKKTEFIVVLHQQSQEDLTHLHRQPYHRAYYRTNKKGNFSLVFNNVISCGDCNFTNLNRRFIERQRTVEREGGRGGTHIARKKTIISSPPPQSPSRPCHRMAAVHLFGAYKGKKGAALTQALVYYVCH